MKKIEAQKLAPEKSKLIIDYIIQILSDKEKTKSKMNLYHAKLMIIICVYYIFQYLKLILKSI